MLQGPKYVEISHVQYVPKFPIYAPISSNIFQEIAVFFGKKWLTSKKRPSKLVPMPCKSIKPMPIL